MKHKRIVGAHLSIAGGLSKIFDQAEAIGANTAQIFTKSNRSFKAVPISPQTSSAFIEAKAKSSMQEIVVHASYLINLASNDPKLKFLGQQALLEELARCNQLGIKYLVLHPGSSKEQTAEEGIINIAAALNKVLQTDHSPVQILLETMASQGSTVGGTFAQLANIRDAVNNKDRIGFCLDTCHIFASGYDFTSTYGWQKVKAELQQHLDPKLFKVVHANDSLKELNSHLDRHASIDQGKIGLQGFSALWHDEHFSKLAWILETPEPATYAQEIQLLLSLDN